jgi:hypothetical protein
MARLVEMTKRSILMQILHFHIVSISVWGL